MRQSDKCVLAWKKKLENFVRVQCRYLEKRKSRVSKKEVEHVDRERGFIGSAISQTWRCKHNDGRWWHCPFVLVAGKRGKIRDAMPSAEEPTYLIKVVPNTKQDFLSRDVDLLMSQIKENLRLSNLKAKSSISYKNRSSPYQIPSRSWADPNNCEVCGTKNAGTHDHRHHMSHRKKRANTREDDPYELLQELLREGGLIKEAVKRLQANLDELQISDGEEEEEEEDEDEEEEEEEEEDEHEQRSVIYRRKPYFYDSEDEQLPTVYEPLEL